MTKSEKVKILQAVAAGMKLTDLPTGRQGMSFHRVEPGLYKCSETGKVHTLEEVDELNRPYKNFSQVTRIDIRSYPDNAEPKHILFAAVSSGM